MYKQILVATDFSPSANAAFKQAVWVARAADCRIASVHVQSDVTALQQRISYDSRQGFSTTELERLDCTLRDDSDRQLKKLASQFGAGRTNIKCQTLCGAPLVEIVGAVVRERYDLVVTGRRGMSKVKQLLLGSTAKRLVRKCPSAVWVVKRWAGSSPKSILIAVDFSDVSAKALQHGAWLAEQSNAQLHLVHVIDSADVPKDLYEKTVRASPAVSVRQRVRQAAKAHFDAFLTKHLPSDRQIVKHLSWGNPWQEIVRLAKRVSADPVVLGTVGRSGIKGILLGNTAERVLDELDGGILTVKPDQFVSPI